jgi:hypothetical protein
MLRNAFLRTPDDPEAMLKLASMDLSNPFTEVQKKSLDMIWTVARGQSPQAPLAIEMLASHPQLTATQCAELLDLLSANTKTTEKLRYHVLSSYAKLRPLDKSTMVEKEVAAHEGQPPEKILDFLRWLYDMDEHERLLKLLPRERATAMPELFPLYVESLVSTKQWAALQKVLKTSPSLPLSPTNVSLLHARCAQALGESAAVINGHLQEACRRAMSARNMSDLTRSANIAESLGYDDVAIETYRNAATLPQYQVPMLERILAIHKKRRDAGAMLQTLQDISNAKPGLRVHQENIFYVKLLIGKELELINAQTHLMADQGKITTDAHQFFQALSAYRMADYEALRGLLAKITPDSLSLGQRAVYSGMLSFSGDKAVAYSIAERIPKSLLLEEELRFLKLAL